MQTVTALQLARELDALPARTPILINGDPVSSVVLAVGRIRRDILSTTFREMPDKPRDRALILRRSPDGHMPLGDVIDALLFHPDLEVFIDGEQVTSFGLVDMGKVGKVAAPLRWIELSDGTQATTHLWIAQQDA